MGEYNRQFLQLWQAMGEPQQAAIKDVDEAVDHCAVVLGLQGSHRRNMYAPLLQAIIQKRGAMSWWKYRGSMNELEAELDMGKCALTLTSHTSECSIIRVAMIAALHVTRPCGAVLLEVAEIEAENVTLQPRLPATKLRQGETAKEAARRCMGA